jgi:predicted DNA-binding antitoxin AbrB/MazE fold protein
MSQEFHAIYENGVLRPITPLNLPESVEVAGTLAETNMSAENGTMSAADLDRQQRALNSMFAEVDKLPQTPRSDSLSGRDHDKILYGSEKRSSSIRERGMPGTSLMMLTTRRP